MSSTDAPLLEVSGVTLQYMTRDHRVTATRRVDFAVYPSDREAADPGENVVFRTFETCAVRCWGMQS